MSFHSLLQKQIEYYLPECHLHNKAMEKFLSAVSNSYQAFEKNSRQAERISIAEEEDCTRNKTVQNKKPKDALRAAIEKIGDNVWEHDYLKEETVFSKRNIEMIDYNASIDTKISDWWMNHIHPDDKHIVKRLDEQYRNGEIDDHEEEYRLINKDGDVHWILDRGIMVERAADGSPLQTLGTHTDITKIKKTEQELRESEQSLRFIAENTPGLLFKYHYYRDKIGFFSYISPDAERKIGITAEQLENFYGILHPDEIAREKRARREALENNLLYHFEGRFVVPGKPVIWLRIASSSMLIIDERSLVYTGIITNITKEKEAELAVQLHEEKYRSIIANMNLGMTEVDNNNIIRYVNQSLCDMCGYSKEELIDKPLSSLFLTNNTMPMLIEKIKLRKEGYSDAYELSVTDKNGEVKWWLVSGAPHFNNRGEVVGAIGIHLDITEQKKMQSDLILARKEAEESARSKQAFLANMSHEVRTPMNAIIGMSRQLAKTSLTERQRAFLETIHSAADNLLVVVNDVLDSSKMDAGKLTLENIGFCLKDVIDRAIHVMEHKAEEKGLLISVDYFDAGIAPVQMGDPYRINQILLNLLSNAVKFTEKGSVNVRCILQNEMPEHQTITIEVQDTGIGMEAPFVEKIFEAFYQEYSSVTRKYGGTGLGMHICKQLVEMMGGTIEVKSRKHVGTSISVTLNYPLGKPTDIQRNEIMPFEAKMLKNKKILVADDNDLNRFLVTVVLQNYNSIVIEAKNGKEAVDVLKKDAVDVVLMDIQMPVMDGLQATRIIRDELHCNVPVVALTANAIKGDHEQYFECGMNSYVLKPFHEDDLVRAIIKELGGREEDVKTIQNKDMETHQDEHLYNLSQLMEISRGDNNFVSKMIGIFIHQAQLFMEEMQEEIKSNNLAQVAAVAHKFKPSVSNICQPFLFDDIKHLEKLALQNEPSEELVQASNKFLNNVNEVVLQLKERL